MVRGCAGFPTVNSFLHNPLLVLALSGKAGVLRVTLTGCECWPVTEKRSNHQLQLVKKGYQLTPVNLNVVTSYFTIN
jgi:hypothetical protein